MRSTTGYQRPQTGDHWPVLPLVMNANPQVFTVLRVVSRGKGCVFLVCMCCILAVGKTSLYLKILEVERNKNKAICWETSSQHPMLRLRPSEVANLTSCKIRSLLRQSQKQRTNNVTQIDTVHHLLQLLIALLN